MAKKTFTWRNFGIALMILFAIFLILPQQEGIIVTGDTQTIFDKDELSECNERRSDKIGDGWQCIGECQIIENIHNSCSSVRDDEIGNYGFYGDRDRCEDLSSSQKLDYECFYGTSIDDDDPTIDDPSSQTCTDTDGGKNYRERGGAEAFVDGVEIAQGVDECMSNSLLLEYFCNDGSLDSRVEDCTFEGISSPYVCVQGECVPSGSSGNDDSSSDDDPIIINDPSVGDDIANFCQDYQGYAFLPIFNDPCADLAVTAVLALLILIIILGLIL